jgi:hypothetical protein
MNKTTWLAGALALALMAGCGGGGEIEAHAVDATGGREVPASALASARAYAEFARSLAVDDRGPPLELGQAEPPTSETDEPVDID